MFLRPCTWLAFLLTLTVAPAAHAEERVVVFSLLGEPPRDGFVQALTIQLAGEAAVEQGPALAEVSLARRLERAVELLGGRGATLGAWIEVVPSTGGTEANRLFELILYAVGGERDTALVHIARIQIAPGDDVERALALKAAEFLDGVLAARVLSQVVVPPLPVQVADPPTRAPVRASGVSRAFLDVGGAAYGGGPAQGAITIDAGARIGVDGVGLELGLGLRIPNGLEASAGPARMTIHEWAVGAVVRAVVPVGPVEVGLGAGVSMRRLDAMGIAADGVVGSAVRWIPATSIEAELRLRLARTVALRLSLGAEVALTDQQFTVDAMPVIRLPRVRGVGQASFVIAID